MGLAIVEALENLLARVDTPGVRMFSRSIAQGETMGVVQACASQTCQVFESGNTEDSKRRLWAPGHKQRHTGKKRCETNANASETLLHTKDASPKTAYASIVARGIEGYVCGDCRTHSH